MKSHVQAVLELTVAEDELEHLILLPQPLDSCDGYPDLSLRLQPGHQSFKLSQIHNVRIITWLVVLPQIVAQTYLISKVFGPRWWSRLEVGVFPGHVPLSTPVAKQLPFSTLQLVVPIIISRDHVPNEMHSLCRQHCVHLFRKELEIEPTAVCLPSRAA